MLRSLLIGFLTLLVNGHAVAQGWVNKGAHVVLKDSVHVVVTTANGHYQAQNNSWISSRNSSFFHIRGNWYNNGNNAGIATNDGTVILDGGGQSIAGLSSTSFYNLSLEGNGNKTLLVPTLVGGGHSGTRSGRLAINDKLLYLNAQKLIVNNHDPDAITRSSGFLIGETGPTLGYSWVQWTIRNQVGSKYTIPFGSTDLIPIPFEIELDRAGTSIQDSGHISVAMYPTNPLAGPNNRPFPYGVTNLDNEFGLENDIKSVDRYYIVESGSYGFQPEVTLRYPYIDREWDQSGGSSNDIVERELRAVRYNTGSDQWGYPGGGNANTTTNQVRYNTAASFTGQWVLFNWPSCPDAQFTFDSACDGLPISLVNRSTLVRGQIDSVIWRLDNTQYTDLDSLGHVFPADGDYDVQLLVRSDRGCWDSITQTITVHPIPMVDFRVGDTCLGQPTNFRAISTTATGDPLTHSWMGPGLALGSGELYAHLYSDTGTFQMQLISENVWGCSDSFTRAFKVREVPQVDFGLEEICEGETASFFDSTRSSAPLLEWEWRVDGEPFSFEQNPNRRFNESGVYDIQLIIRNAAGCSDSILRKQLVKPRALAGFSHWPNPVRISEPVVRFLQQSEDANDFLWDFGDGSPRVEVPEPQHEYPDTGYYSVVLVANNDGNCPDTTVNVIYIAADIRIFIPNAFTPQGPDNLNSTFKPVGILHGMEEFYMEIYNRWGELLYVTEDIDRPWDGTYRGVPVEQDSYLYQIKIVDVFRNEHWYKGIVTLLR